MGSDARDMGPNATAPGKTAICGGRLVDGCGNPWVRADLLMEHDTIAGIVAPGGLRHLYGVPDVRVIDAADRYVTPGFIDPHTHSDLTILDCPDAESALRMGVTTHVTGNCGMSPAPIPEARRSEVIHQLEYYWKVSNPAWKWSSFKEYMDVVDGRGIGINIAPLVGHGTLRAATVGLESRAPTAAEMKEMKELLAQSLTEGAFGLSTGLVYPPGCYSHTAELVELARVAAHHGGIYVSHVRGERETFLAAIDEAVRIGEEAGLPVELSHNAPKWGGPPAADSLERASRARRHGVDATVDNDTHTDFAPRLSRALPQPVADLAHDELMDLLKDDDRRLALKQQITADRLPAPGYAGLLVHACFDRIVIIAAADQALVGHSVQDVADRRAADPLDTYLSLILENDDDIAAIFDYIHADDVTQVLGHPLAMVSSDGLVVPSPSTGGELLDYSPCSYGEHARVLEHFVKERGLLRLEDAVRRMTSFPAQRFGLWDRGVLRPGLKADIVVFDLDAIRDRATNEYPHTYPFANIPAELAEGMDYVFVNGRPAIDGGTATGDRGGRVLRRHQVARQWAAGESSVTGKE